MRTREIKRLITIWAAVFAFALGGPAHAQDWPDIFAPDLFPTLNLEMSPVDWDVILADETFEIEVPAWFWMDGEEDYKFLVSVRRKSGDPIPAGDRIKISLKIDINQYLEQEWHGLIKLSLENGDDNNVLREGIVCNLHQMASGTEGYGYDAWRANWVKLYVNTEYQGVYINAEQLDRKFLENRGLYIWHETWLYKYVGDHNFELSVGDDSNPRSQTVNELCYFPFAHGSSSSLLHPDGGICSPPDDAGLVTQLNNLINMQGMLAMAAVNIFAANPDSLFTHQRNSNFLDFNTDNPAETRKRMYIPWDVDAAMQSTSFNIYPIEEEYSQIILGNPVFRVQYDQIMLDIINGPLCETNIHALIDMIEPILTDAVAADPGNQLDSPGAAGVAEEFDSIRDWYSDRIDNVLIQLGASTQVNISGCIVDPVGMSIGGVLVSADNGGGADTTDSNGYYEVLVDRDWSGIVTPTKSEYTFDPLQRTYSNLTVDQFDQNYQGTSIYDLDGDGLPDDWETSYFGNLDHTANGDDDIPQGDGATNYEEWVAGTDPTNPDSVLRIENIARIHNPLEVQVTWSSVAGKYYAVYFSDDSIDSLMTWTLAQDMIPASGTGTNTWIDDGSLTGSSPDVVPYRFYRLELLRQW